MIDFRTKEPGRRAELKTASPSELSFRRRCGNKFEGVADSARQMAALQERCAEMDEV
jgi:hypothetical protein